MAVLKRVLIVLLFTISAAVLSADSVYSESWYRIRWINDGDTVILEDGRRIRYIGIDTPELAHEDRKAEPFGEAAGRFNRQMVFNKKVRLEFDRERRDRYGRTLAYVFLEDGTLVNAHLLEEGYGHYLSRKPNRRYSGILLSAQRRAMSAGKGIWGELDNKRVRVIGNISSTRFCPFGKQILKKNRVEFSSEWLAYWDGYSPCNHCIP